MYLINPVIAETMTTGRMIPSGNNSSPAEALKTFIINIIFIFTGFTGTLCELLDPNSVCYNNPCQNQGTCRNTISLRDYICTCKNGYTGKKVHCILRK